MHHEPSAPRRRRSSFRAPTPGSVDPVALTKLFGGAASGEPLISAESDAPLAAEAAPTFPVRRRSTAQTDEDRAPKHRAAPAGNRRAGANAAGADAEVVDAAAASAERGAAEHGPAFDDIVFAGAAGGRAELRQDGVDQTSASPVTATEPVTAATGSARAPEAASARPAPDPANGAQSSLVESFFDDLDPAGSQPDPSLASAPPTRSRTRPGTGASTSSRTRAARASHDPAPAEPDSRRARRRPRHLAVASSAAALLVLAGLGAVAVANDVPATLFDASASSAPDGSGDAVAGPSAPTVTSPLSESAVPFTGGTTVTVAGEHLDQVAQVQVAGVAAEIVESSAAQLTFTVPATSDTSVGPAEVVFADRDGRPVKVAVDASDATAAAEASTEAEPASTDPAEASTPATDAAGSLTLTYTSDPAIDAQLAYVLAHWSDYNTAEYPAVRGKDAVNFASQSLVARGWAMDDAWNVDAATGAMSAAWSSSTALRDYLLTRAERATELTDAQRDQVKVGDLAQFDWDDSGDRDHTAIVTRVEHSDSGTKVWVASHTKDADYWDVDAALASGGGSVSWFSIR